MENIKVIKKDGTLENYDFQKIINAVNKSAERVVYKFTQLDLDNLKLYVECALKELHENIDITSMHSIVESALNKVNKDVAKAYRDYRNYKTSFVSILDKVYKKRKDLEYLADVDNANRDSALVSTQRSITYDTLNGELYKEFFLNVEERQAMKDGFIYVHDRSARLDTMNCCLFDMANVLKDGFEMGNVWYNEPNSLDTAFDVISDVTISGAAQQYGGFTIPEVDKILAPYAQKSYDKYFEEYKDIVLNTSLPEGSYWNEFEIDKKADKYATAKVRREFEQGFQGWEYKFNTVGSSRGDYPFIATSFGIGTSKFEVMATEAILEVRKNGQGKKGFKKPVLFPKLTFLYDKNLHGPGKEFEWLFDKAIECSSKAMYPDYLSLTGEGYIPSIYKKYGRVVSLMGALDAKEHLYLKINNEEPIDISIKDFFNFCKTGKLENYRKCQLFFNKSNVERIEQRQKRLDINFEHKPGVYKITYIPEDLNYIGSSSDVKRRFREHICSIRKTGSLDAGLTIGDYNLNNYKFEVLEYSSNYKELEKKYIKEIPNINYRGTQSKYYKQIGSFKDVLTRPTNKQDLALGQDLIKLENLDIKVLDRDNKWVKVKCIFKNDKKHTPAMMHIYYIDHNKEYCLSCTEDHPLWTGKDFTRADELTLDNKLYKVDGSILDISRITYNWTNVDSYDIETETGSFIGSDIIMHNCRASLSPWYEKGGMNPADENDKPVFVGRFNLGAISLNLPMIALKAKNEQKDFYEVLDYYLELIRGLHKKTFEFLSHKKASTNPLGYMQGGFLNGNKSSNEELGEDYLRPMTMSFGITALNEMEQAWHGKSIVEDGSFALEVMTYINEYVNRIKKEDNILYAIYGTPAESLAGLQAKQIKDMYGVIPNVSDRSYVTNSFHCPVWEDISGFEKQDLENRFWNLLNGGKIQYVRYPVMYNLKAMKDTVRRAMDYGFYEGVNLSLAYCEECGYQQLEMDKCPKCGSELITKIDRMNGYLGYTRVHGNSRYNKAKMDEIKDRKSM
ncbi:anaerobic ribonucleoside-triphosphate reductase [uncultured Clostridium sp.]|uniref:anaerobic ribonucleoside-triphosphate reductase n=1 Tax=uncultured Clostridium sp. TaxID=59620 RepID=UPI002636D914|nr:anaerobic ribonucleoside-triphosphate reductase [uncultured Clostridium sp.]